ncbi:MAG: Ig domain-containing protein [Gemmatimonadales bacterium]
MYRRLRAVLVLAAAGACKNGSGPIEPTCNVTSVAIQTSQASFTMNVGQVVDLQAAVNQSGCPSIPALTYSSSNPQIVSVSGSGTVTAVAVGTATVTVGVQGTNVTAAASVTVIGRVLSLTVAPDSSLIAVAGTVQLTPTVTADPGTSAAVEWTSASPTVATVSPTGLVTGVGAGSTLVTVRSTADPTKVALATIVVVPRVTAVTVTPTHDTILVVESLPINATVTGDPGIATTVTWRTSDPAIATVAAAPGGSPGAGSLLLAGATVTGVAAGTATITAVATGDTTKKAAATIVVQPRVFGITVDPPNATLFVGGTRPLTATVAGDPGVSVEVTWTSSDPGKATVSPAGVVTGVALGTATITARSVADPNRTATSAITVAPQVISVAVTPGSVTLAPGATAPFTATVTADPGVPTTVTWSSQGPAIATVAPDGLATAVSQGTTSIVAASTHDPAKSGSATVTVTAPTGVPLGDLCFNWVAPPVGEAPRPTGGGPASFLASPQCPTEIALDLTFHEVFEVQAYRASTSNDVTISVALEGPGLVNVDGNGSGGLLIQGAASAGETVLRVETTSGPPTVARIRVRLSSDPKSVCPALTPTGPCVTAVTVGVGASLTIYAREVGSPVAAAATWSFLGTRVTAPFGSFNSSVTITGASTGAMLGSLSSTTDPEVFTAFTINVVP